ncbi:MAG TPA: hypothetical protein VFS47_06625 [Steroidobacteraceae bacterium]|nr:hypothetical protein [Steroidobacteraceae bacterium]
MSSIKPFVAFAALTILANNSNAAAPPAADILITAFHDKQWQVRYDLPHPTKEMVFARSPDDSRERAWLPDELFEIVETDHGEAVRRKDGREFTTLRIRMSAEYRVLPNDYAPFSPFGDGGMLFHTGRYFACGGVCSKDASWSMSLWADPKDSIVLNGKPESYYAEWKDSRDGTFVYVGKNIGKESNGFTAIIDRALPDAVRSSLLTELPRSIEDFSANLGKLEDRTIVFASYDEAYRPGWGRQGDVLGNEIATHIYGNHWRDEMQKPDFALDLAWYFAHETAHLYQRQLYPSGPGDAWIHEGSAEAFAAIALRNRGAAEAAYVAERVGRAEQKCTQDLSEKTLQDVLSADTQDLSAAYSCGLLLSLYIDEQIRTRGKDGLYAVWRNYLRVARSRDHRSRAAYLAAIGVNGGADLVQQVQSRLRIVHPF